MKYIRIGNDIQVRATLSELGQWDSINIKSICCYFVRVEDVEKSKYPQFYTPTQYSMNCCGCCSYNVMPNNTCFTDSHWFPGYNGFGVYSTPFENEPNGFRAPVKVLEEQNRVEAYFPAQEQRYTGAYKIIFVVQLYEYGWNINNTRTFTIDKGEVFTLTKDSEESSSSIIIDLDDANEHTILILGENIDNKKTTLPTSIKNGGSINGTIWLDEGYIITRAIMTIDGRIVKSDFTLNNQYIDVNYDNVTDNVVIHLTTRYVGITKVVINGNNLIDTEKTTILSSYLKGSDIDGYVYVKNEFIIVNANYVVDANIIQLQISPNSQRVHIKLSNVSADLININITAKPNESSN